MVIARSLEGTSSSPSAAAIVWFRNDLRVADHEPLHAALSSTPAALLPLYCLDYRQLLPRHVPDLTATPLPTAMPDPQQSAPEDPLRAASLLATETRQQRGIGTPQLGPYRLRALLEALSSLHTALHSRGSGLAFHQGVAEEVLGAAASALCKAQRGPQHAQRTGSHTHPSQQPMNSRSQLQDGEGTEAEEEETGGEGDAGTPPGGSRRRTGLEGSAPARDGPEGGLAPAWGVIELHYYMEVEGEAVEAAVERAVRAAAEEHGVPCTVHRYWGHTLYHPEDLPYHLYEAGASRQHVQHAQQRDQPPQCPSPPAEPPAAEEGQGWRCGAGGLGRDAVDPRRFRDLPDVMTNFRKVLQAHTEVRRPLPPPTSLPPLPDPPPSLSAPLLGQGVPCSVQDIYSAAGPAAAAAVRRLEALAGRDILGSLPSPSSGPPDTRSALPFTASEQQAMGRLRAYLGLSAGPRVGEMLGGGVPAGPPIQGYQDSRMKAYGVDTSAKLSMFMSLGCLSPRTVFWEAQTAVEMEEGGQERGGVGVGLAGVTRGDERTLRGGGSQQGWREPVRGDGARWLQMHLGIRDFFIYTALKRGAGSLLELAGGGATWRADVAGFERWACGQTGLPFVDACMRELGGSGFMSNRGRQNVASFLAKGLQIDWRPGALLFESLLVDHDFAVNTLNWAYNSGTGNDPRNRQFKTVSQGEQYDPDAVLIQAWVPELAHLPAPQAHRPWEAGPGGGAAAVAELRGSSADGPAACVPDDGVYPPPMVDPAGQIKKERGGKGTR